MKKKILFGALLIACLSFGVACDYSIGAGDPTPTPNTPIAPVIPGTIPETGLYIDIPEDTEVEIGEFFTYSQAAIALNGKVYEPTVSIAYGEETVEAQDGYFSVQKVGEYTISYSFTAEGQAYNYKTKVTGVDTVAPSIKLSEGEFTYKCRIGDEVKIPSFEATDLSGDVENLSVKILDEDGEEVSLTDGKFTVEDYGGYQLIVEAKDSSDNAAAEFFNIAVYQPNELEYFNSEQFLEKTVVCKHSAVFSYTEKEEAVIEGNGAGIFKTPGKWSMVHFVESKGLDYESIDQISFWVYNNTVNTYKLDVEVLDDARVLFDDALFAAQGNAYNVAHAYYHAVLYPHVWTQIKVSGESLKTAVNTVISKSKIQNPEPYFSLSLNGSDNEAYAQGEFFIDAFQIAYKGETYADISPADINMDIPASTGAGVDVTIAKAADVLKNVNPAQVNVTATCNGSNVTVAYDETKGGWYIPSAKEGTYSVYYFYANGEKSAAATQKVELFPEFTDGRFESGNIDMKRISVTSGAAALSVASIAGSDGLSTNALKMSNETSDPYVTVNLGKSFFKSITDDETLKFKIRFDLNEALATSNTSYLLQVYNKQGGTMLFSDNNVCRGVNAYGNGRWYEYALTKDDLALVKESGSLTFRLWLYQVGSVSKAFDLYIDDIVIADATFDGSFETTYELPANFFGKAWSASNPLFEQNNSPEGSVNTLRILTYKDADNPLITMNFGERFVNSIEEGDTLSFRIYVAKGACSATAMKVFMGTAQGVYNILPTDNVVEPNTWVTYNVTFTKEMVESYRGSGLLYLGLNAHGADVNVGDGRAANYYLDDFVITKAQKN